MLIRNAHSQDVDQLQKITRRNESQIANRIDLQSQGRAEYLVVESEDRLVSFVFLKYYGKETYPHIPDIEDLYTKEEERSKGYATALLLECEAKAKQKGFRAIGLAAGVDPADPARRLYEKLGYRYDGKESYVDGVYDGVKDWVVDMVKNLDGQRGDIA